jgi:RNA polymerase sigma-70 factor (ECF subfamily)
VANDLNEDKATVEAVLGGDRQQFARLVQQYHRPLLNLAKSRLGDLDLAEEAVQDAFICAFRSLHTYKPKFSFRTWLWTILLNQCRRHGSRSAKLPRQLSTEFLPKSLDKPSSESTPDVAAMIAERSRLLDGLLLELSDVQADAIRLRFFGQLKYREIADAMDSSLGAAKQRVKLGLIAIGEMLRDRALIDSVFPDTKP